MNDWPLKNPSFHCACRFSRAEDFGLSELIEPCGFHSKMAKELAEAEAKVLGQGHIEAQRDQFARELDGARVEHQHDSGRDPCQYCGARPSQQHYPDCNRPRDVAPKRHVHSEHVAWLRYDNHNCARPTTISLCDSDSPGAFKVYRKADALLEELRVFWPDVRQLMDGFMNGDPNFTEWDHQVRNRAIELSFKLNGMDVPPEGRSP